MWRISKNGKFGNVGLRGGRLDNKTPHFGVQFLISRISSKAWNLPRVSQIVNCFGLITGRSVVSASVHLSL